jgi:5-methylcytosine-specific restriction endonuclease McrA
MISDKILVLNSDSSPMSVMTFDRGFRLAYIGKAQVVSHVEDKPVVCNIREEDYLNLIDICPSLLLDDYNGFKRPTIVRLNQYVYTPYKKVTLSRFNIYKRDSHECVYCGSKNNLTIDHVKPRYHGGKNTWDNLVTCCGKCNLTKGHLPLDRFLKENGLNMKHTPYKPTYLEFLSTHGNLHEDWKPYVLV